MLIRTENGRASQDFFGRDVTIYRSEQELEHGGRREVNHLKHSIYFHNFMLSSVTTTIPILIQEYVNMAQIIVALFHN